MTALAPNFTLQLEDLIANDRRERLGRFDPNVLTWLAIVPEWTERGTVVAPGALDVGFPLPTTSYSSFGEFLD